MFFQRTKVNLTGLFLFLLMLSASVCLLIGYRSRAAKAASAVFPSQSASNQVLVCLFTDRIQEQTDRFYAAYYTVSPTIAYYMTAVKNIEKEDGGFSVTFAALPYLGPHDTIGEDEIIFRVRHSGETTLIAFRHLKSYPLPDNLRSLEKGALPPVSR